MQFAAISCNRVQELQLAAIFLRLGAQETVQRLKNAVKASGGHFIASTGDHHLQPVTSGDREKFPGGAEERSFIAFTRFYLLLVAFLDTGGRDEMDEVLE